MLLAEDKHRGPPHQNYVSSSFPDIHFFIVPTFMPNHSTNKVVKAKAVGYIKQFNMELIW